MTWVKENFVWIVILFSFANQYVTEGIFKAIFRLIVVGLMYFFPACFFWRAAKNFTPKEFGWWLNVWFGVFFALVVVFGSFLLLYQAASLR